METLAEISTAVRRIFFLKKHILRLSHLTAMVPPSSGLTDRKSHGKSTQPLTSIPKSPFNYAFLPPQSPHRSDHQQGGGPINKSLMKHITESGHLLRDLNPTKYYQQRSTIIRTSRTFGTMHRTTKSLSVNVLENALCDARDGSV